jgi:hypothetical protein
MKSGQFQVGQIQRLETPGPKQSNLFLGPGVKVCVVWSRGGAMALVSVQYNLEFLVSCRLIQKASGILRCRSGYGTKIAQIASKVNEGTSCCGH